MALGQEIRNMEKKCIICNKIFYVRPSHFESRKCCSVDCGIKLQTGNKYTEEHKRNIRKSLKGKPFSGIPYDWNGRKQTKEHLKHSSEAHLGQVPWNKGLKGYGAGRKHPWMAKGSDHYNWRGGKSFEPYGLEFNNDLKEVIRNRDRRKCQICGKTEIDIGQKMTVHHIDANKQNNNPKNLISLCRVCHGKTNHKRYFWVKYFKII